jgi:hypothetical protein
MWPARHPSDDLASIGLRRAGHDHQMGASAAECGRGCTEAVIFALARRGANYMISRSVRGRPDVAVHAPSR